MRGKELLEQLKKVIEEYHLEEATVYFNGDLDQRKIFKVVMGVCQSDDNTLVIYIE